MNKTERQRQDEAFEHEAYYAIAEELGGDLTMDDMSNDYKEAGRRYARRCHRPWPPHPTSTGWEVRIYSL